MSAGAQNVTFINRRDCTVDIKLVGTTPSGGSCGDYGLHYYVAPGTTMTIPFGAIGIGAVPPVAPPPPGLVWNYAEIQNMGCCDGGGLGVGGTVPCINPVTSLLMYPGPTVCNTGGVIGCGPFCATWSYPGPGPNDIQIFCY